MNPFLPFTPVSGADFVNRQNELKEICKHIARRTHTAIVGNPHVGKTSLLRQAATPSVFTAAVPNAERYALVEIESQLFGESDTTHDFWHELLTQATAANSAITALLKPLLDEKKIDEQALYRAFQQVDRAQGRVVAFIDEFDYLPNLKRFWTLDFLSVLRTIAMKSGGLVVVAASRASVAELNLLGQQLKATRGSDLFNYLDELTLGCFDAVSTQTWLAQQLATPTAAQEARWLAGHHPLLLQLAGDLLYDALEAAPSQTQFDALRETFISKAESQFQDVWNYLSPKAQVALVIFALATMDGAAGRQTFDLSDAVKTLDWYEAEVKEMARRGTIERDANGKYRIPEAFRLWLVERKIVGTRGEETTEAFTQWLRDKQFKLGGLITNEELNKLQKIWQAIPKDVIGIAKKLFLPKALQ